MLALICYQLFVDRLALAALHFNENASRKQAVTLKGEEHYDILFPKYKKGGHIVRKVTVDPTYGKSFTTMTHYSEFIIDNNYLTGYVDVLMKETIRRCEEGITETLPDDTPAPLSSQYERPDKPIAVKSHKIRFIL